MDKNKVKNNAIRLISIFGDNIQTKISNACGKVGPYYVPEELKYLIYKDLNKLKDHIRIAKGDKLRTPDFFDIRFNLYDDFNHLSFDMYEHLDKYIEHTQESVTKGKNKKY